MKITHRFHSFLVAVTAALVIASTATAQTADELPVGAQTADDATAGNAEQPPASPPRLTFIDRRMATYLAIDTQAGIELAEWAGAHARDERVRQFAARLAGDLAALLKVLDERTDGRATASLRDDDEDSESGAAKLVRPAKRSLRSMLDLERTLMRMKLEIASDSAMSLTSQFESRPPNDVDLCYIGSEVFRQVQTLSTLKVLRSYGSNALGAVFDNAIALAERQLAETLAVQASLVTPPAAPLPALPMPVAGAN